MGTQPTRALVVDDHPIITDALSSALISLRVFDGVDRESSVATAFLRLQSGTTYNLVLLDLHLSDASGLEAMLAMRVRFPDTPVMIFSGDDSSATITAAFEHGVQGYVPKSSPMGVVIGAIRVVLAGGIHIPPQAIRMLGFNVRPPPDTSNFQLMHAPNLSPRQQQVFQYLLQGFPNKVIGARLEMADGTVKSHLNAVYRMFSVNSRAQLILKARDFGLI
jgi:DNA-binding NarL/FixJ family response regulator